MRTIFALACLPCLLSSPAHAQETYGLAQRVDDLQMRLNDLELSRTPPPTRYSNPVLGDDVKPLPPCRVGSICTLGLVLEPSRQTLNDVRGKR